MTTKRRAFEALPVRPEIKDIITKLRDDSGLNYNRVIEYLLVKAGCMSAEDCEYNYIATAKVMEGR